MPRQQTVRGDPPVQNCPYTEDEITQMNRKHDQRYGWTVKFPTLYLNPNRMPETFHGPAERLWPDS